jgi:osmotically-inducible protein OsmY
MNDATLSENAKKVTVTAKDGVVTLQGTVASEDEKKSIESSVRAVPNVRDVVTTDLEVRP